MKTPGVKTDMLVRQHSPKASSIWNNWVSQCGNPSCSPKTLLQTLTHRRRGMKVENDWYCGATCFEQVVKAKIEELIISQGKPSKARSSRVPLGLLLLSRGVLTSEQLEGRARPPEVDGIGFWRHSAAAWFRNFGTSNCRSCRAMGLSSLSLGGAAIGNAAPNSAPAP